MSTVQESITPITAIPAEADVLEPSDDRIFKALLTHPNAGSALKGLISAVIELDKLNKLLNKPVEDMALIEEWSVFFKYAPDPKHRDLVNSVINKNGGIAMAATLLMEISKDEHERARLRSRKMAETDRISDLLTAEARGKEEALNELKKLAEQGLVSLELIEILREKLK